MLAPKLTLRRLRLRHAREASNRRAKMTISIPGSEAAVIRHFQERMPYGLFVPDVP